MLRVWNTSNFDVVVPQVGKVRAGSFADIPHMSSQLKHLLDVGFLSATPPPEPEKKIEVDVGIVSVEISPGPDGELGTPDDVVEIKPKKRKKRKSTKKKKED